MGQDNEGNQMVVELIGTTFYENAANLITESRKAVASTANVVICVTNFIIGRMLVQEEQKGQNRAKYGTTLLKTLSEYLTVRFGRGFSETNLRSFRKFYLIYREQIEDLSSKEVENSNLAIQQKASAEFKLSWSHYQVLMRISDQQMRRFYEIEAFEGQWSVPQLKRQYNSSLYERLALSRNKEEVLKLANEGQTIEKPQDVLKNPFVLEFLGMEEKAEYSESDLESAIISKLQNFLLELGKGFLFEARQKRFSFDEKNFFVDLVFYNRLLQCYVLIDLKTDELKHQDLGQMQMYVNFFNRYVKQEFEKPTIGILLCKEKSDSIVQLTLPPDANIYASEYSLYLPDKALLQKKMDEWTQEYELSQNKM